MPRSGCYPIVGAMSAVNPEILVWARKTSGLTLQDAVAKVGIRDARRRCGYRPALPGRNTCFEHLVLATWTNVRRRKENWTYELSDWLECAGVRCSIPYHALIDTME